MKRASRGMRAGDNAAADAGTSTCATASATSASTSGVRVGAIRPLDRRRDAVLESVAPVGQSRGLTPKGKPHEVPPTRAPTDAPADEAGSPPTRTRSSRGEIRRARRSSREQPSLRPNRAAQSIELGAPHADLPRDKSATAAFRNRSHRACALLHTLAENHLFSPPALRFSADSMMCAISRVHVDALRLALEVEDDAVAERRQRPARRSSTPTL